MKKIIYLCLLLCGLFESSFVHAQSTPVIWSPSKLNITVATGTSYSSDVVIKSDHTLSGLSIEVVPALNSYITVEPNNIALLEPGSPVTVKVSVAPSNQVFALPLDGTIHVKKGNSTIPQTLKISLNVVAPSSIDDLNYQTSFTQVASVTIKAKNGAVIEIPESSITLTVPANALLRNENVTISEVNNPPFLPTGLSFVGVPVDLKPDGLILNSPAVLEMVYTDNDLADAGVVDENSILLFSFNVGTGVWSQVMTVSVNANTNTVRAEITHFSHYAVTGLRDEPPENLGVPRKGDLVYRQGRIFFIGDQAGWWPGHVGMFTDERDYPGTGLASETVKMYGKYNVIEALPNGVQYSYYDFPNVTESQTGLPIFAPAEFYMGARQPKSGPLTSVQRDAVVEFTEQQIGKKYAWAQTEGWHYGMLSGQLVKGFANSFNCVGLGEKAYEVAGNNGGDGLVSFLDELGVLTVAEQYNATDPAEPEPIAVLEFSAPAYSVDEDANEAVITVIRTLNTSGTVGVDYAVTDGTAMAGLDYITTSGTLTFGPGESSNNFEIPILTDAVFDGDETVNLILSNPTQGASLGIQSTAVLTIKEEQVEVQEISTKSGWTGEVLATRRTWSINGQQFVEVERFGVTKRICPSTGVFLDCPGTWNVWKFVPLQGNFITPGASFPPNAIITVTSENIVTESCEDLDPNRQFSSGPASCPTSTINDETFTYSPVSNRFLDPLCFSTHRCWVYDPASSYLGSEGYTSELLTGCISEACPAGYNCPLPCVEGNANYPACLTQGHCPGTGKMSAELNDPTVLESYILHQNYPNPFNPETNIRFGLPQSSHVVLQILSILGEEIRTLTNAQYEAGYHNVRWDGKDNHGNAVSNGIYFYQIRAGDHTQVKMMSLFR